MAIALRKMLLSATIATIICALSGCSSAQPPPASAPSPTAYKKILIVYLSRTNNTKAIAEFIHENVGGTLVPLEVEKPYPEDYEATVQQVAKENETGYLPPLKTKIADIEKYDVVFLGFPTWGMQLPPPMKSFLKQYSLKGKTVIPFNTNGGTILESFTTRGGVERDGVPETEVKNWMRKIKMLQ